MQAVCSQFASASGAADTHFTALYKKLNDDRALFKWPYGLERTERDEQESESESDLDANALAPPAAAASTGAAAAATAVAATAATAATRAAATATAQREAEGVVAAEVAALSAEAAALRVAAGGQESALGGGVFIAGEQGRVQGGAYLSQGLGSSPIARSEGSAINTPLPGKA